MFRRQFFKIRTLYFKFFREEVLVLGDSHSAVFNEPLFLKEFHEYVFNVVNVGGATVSGLANPNSKTQAMPTYDLALRKYKGNKVIVLIGEVDVGFIIWYRAKKYGSSIESTFEQVVEKYKTFLLDIQGRGLDILVIPAPLPTIADNTEMGDVANARKSIGVSQLKRTELTLEFNHVMNNFCSKNNIHNLDYDDEFLDFKTGLVNKKFLNSDPLDHHYNPRIFSRIIAEHISDEFIKHTHS
ncbi:hypothetical protein BCS65_19980 [Vibrio cyclitrophicus]